MRIRNSSSAVAFGLMVADVHRCPEGEAAPCRPLAAAVAGQAPSSRRYLRNLRHRRARRAYEEEASITRGGEEQLDKKMDVKLDMELDMKTSHGRVREEREECAREGKEVQAGPSPAKLPPRCALGPARFNRAPDGRARRTHACANGQHPKDKDAADLMTWRDYEALRNEMRREFRTQDDELRGEVFKLCNWLLIISLNNSNKKMKTLSFRMKHVVLVVVLDVVTVVVALLNSELAVSLHNNMMMLWRLHDYTDDRKVKLASLEFDGYALRWWDGVTRARQEDNELSVLTWREMKAIMQARFVPTNYLRTIYDKLTLLRQGVKTVDVYFMEMEMLMQRGRVRESLEMTMQRFLHGLKYDIKGIVRHHSYTTMNELLHHAREAEAQLAEEAQIKGRATGAGRYTPRAPQPTAPAPSSRSAPYSTPSSKPVSNVSNTKKSESAASTSGSSMSTARNRDMNCHTCGGKGHFKRDCPNRKVMIINEDNEYETGDDVDPNAPEDDDYDSDGVDAFPSEARTIVVSQRALNVQPSASTQRCNLFQTKALVGPDKACKVIIDGGSCRNLASKELCAKLKLKYLPHPHPYYIQWLSDNGEMKVNHMVRVEFAIGPYKDSFDFDVVPMTVCHLLLGRPWLYDRSVQHNGRANTYHLEFKGKKINLKPMSPQQIVKSRQKTEVHLDDADGL
ncbi:hypothetical protein QYE76_044290 [Lolium multiflorum]|uniref:CCHC-type domain-containing protein n=1 Tax=Lolium multiflorum TaxID=4521 RepID=A0AAD8TKF1_LOLMU|nr:hypothetical protein QYE76_044290 [Lolium multiflorum]